MMIYKHKEGVPIDDFKQMLMKEYKMSIIEWQTEIPKEEGRYIITTSQNEVTQLIIHMNIGMIVIIGLIIVIM